MNIQIIQLASMPVPMRGTAADETKRFQLYHADCGKYQSWDTIEEAVYALSSDLLVCPDAYEIREVINGRRAATYDRLGNLK